ncbi:GNAT family N-acetyltransferase [Roseomonas sp. AR75]|uniref:GNAT family N-acetyltransferase n=1 Tax=Roseomonas sp. AR75 TaxID=2562311 RepID=UPI0010C0DF60|nr:GNAT family N-acetyltransferase [Roseomonas sp. AR75]
MQGIAFRAATEDDLPAIVEMLADDPLGREREAPGMPLAAAYRAAFAAIDADANQLLAVAEDAEGVVGTLQVSFIPGLSHTGAWRGQIEGVRIAARRRGSGLGAAMIEWAVAQCRARGCRMVQLTTSKSRGDAQRFYDRLGFRATHEGYKLSL